MGNRAIFLDRDGVVNKEKNYVHKFENFELVPNALKGLKRIDFENYLVLILTNQAGIAKGYYTKEEFKEFDRQMKDFLSEKGINIAKTYFCPHHSEAKIKKFKKKCSCRKPGIGMLKKAEEEFNLNLSHSYLIGDKTSDILAGKRAGCATILVETGYGGEDELFSIEPDFVVPDLYEAVRLINKSN